MWRDQNLSGQFLGGISKTISESNGIQLKPVKTCWNIWTHTFFPSQVPCLDTVKIHINWECGENVEMSRKWYPCDLPCDLLWWSMMICYVEKVISLSLSSIEFSLSSHCVVDSFDGSLPPGSLPVSSASRSLAANSQLSVIYTMYLLYLAI